MGKSRRFLLLLGLFLAVALVPVRAQDIDLGLRGTLVLYDSVASLGQLKTDPIDPTLEYFEAEGALNFLVVAIVPGWQVFLSGTDFVAGAERIPLERLEWKLSGGNYRRMLASGRSQEIIKNTTGGLLYLDNLSFRLVLRGDESPGRYNSTLTLSLVFP